MACYTLWHHVKLNTQGVIENSFCNVSSAMNCDQVALSQHSEIAGLPTAAWALLLYSTLLALILFKSFSSEEKESHHIKSASAWIASFSFLNLVPTIALAVVSATTLKTLCLMCVALYAINFALAFFAFKTMKASKSSFSDLSLKAPGWVWSVLVAGIALSLFMPTVFKSSLNAAKLDEKAIAQLVAHMKSQSTKTISQANSPYLGNKDAKIVITEYSDFQCPYCARSAQTLPLLLKDYWGEVKLVMKNFPLNAACNPHVTSAGHPLACQAAKTARCVFELKGNDAYATIKNTLFKNQSSLSRNFIEETAVSMGLTKEELDSCVSKVSTQDSILADVNEAQAIGVQGTPAVYINGKYFRGAVYPVVFKAAIESLIEEQK